MALIERSNEELVRTRLAGDFSEANRLVMVISEAECALKLITE